MTHPRRIYVASSWRNAIQPDIVSRLRDAGHAVYDFRNPAPGQKGFSWRDCGGEAAGDGPGHGARTPSAYLEAIRSERAAEGFSFDKEALEWCDTCILVLPCGRSAHLELGYAAGQGKDTYVLLHEDKFEPELMYLLNTEIATDLSQILEAMNEREPGDVVRWHSEAGGYFGRTAGHALRLLQETIELCVAAGADQNEIVDRVAAEIEKAGARGEMGMQNVSGLVNEWADCAILLELFRRHMGIDEVRVMRRKLDTLWRRDWAVGKSGTLFRPACVPASECP